MSVTEATRAVLGQLANLEVVAINFSKSTSGQNAWETTGFFHEAVEAAFEDAPSPVAIFSLEHNSVVWANAKEREWIGDPEAHPMTETSAWLIAEASGPARFAVVEIRDVGLDESLDALAASTVVIPDSLSPREREVVDLILTGHRVSNIATVLRLSEFTVRNHLRSIFAKMGVTSQSELVGALRS